jgi:hypothetical protein
LGVYLAVLFYSFSFAAFVEHAIVIKRSFQIKWIYIKKIVSEIFLFANRESEQSLQHMDTFSDDRKVILKQIQNFFGVCL